ncbi:spore coat protein [Salipaludibacillus agaradhaerens]|jgi:similar to spore coat protein|uniref:spore coat protein n=1 Tax=Salipaludibacillus agaradhaerens TaxID=76935 RepID=UPI002151DE38|nr:spore coat protein [Salipaludibacillus agaradhaerens]MCR6104922.1 spore coat protein [Salipaludibacillus agaradhaerens]MCR6116969.1 spore coat protein [Salipaludibacillus agaradhaerens]
MTDIQLNANDHAIATSMLFESKAAIKDIATALSETASAEVHALLTSEIWAAINQHEAIYQFLQNNGIYDAYNVPEQLQKDIQYVDRALNH